MKLCEKCGQLFLIELDSCPLCNQRKRNTIDAKSKLVVLIKKLRQGELDPDFLLVLNNMEKLCL